MSNVGNKYKIGFLVIAGSAVLVVGLLALGAFKSLRTTYDFCTVLNCSVQGLDKGAKVKFRGVAIGEVKQIKIMAASGILVIMKFDPEAFARSYNEKLNLKDASLQQKFLEALDEDIKKGLRCKLSFAGLTGSLYIEMDYVDPAANPPPTVVLPSDAPSSYVPSVESASIAAVIAESQKTMANIGRIDFARLANKAETFMDSADALLNDKRISKTLDQTVEVTGNLRDLSDVLRNELDRDKLSKLAKDVQATFDNLNAALNDMRTSMKGANIPETTTKARDLMSSADQLVKKADIMRAELGESINKLNATLDSARLLLDLLERNPSSILRGKAAAPVVANPETAK